MWDSKLPSGPSGIRSCPSSILCQFLKSGDHADTDNMLVQNDRLCKPPNRDSISIYLTQLAVHLLPRTRRVVDVEEPKVHAVVREAY